MNLSMQPRKVGPLPADPQGQRLCQIFSHPWDAIYKPDDPNSSWQTLTKHPLAPRELWLRWQDTAQIVGVRFGSKTVYGMIDLDVKGAYHPIQDAKALPLIRAALETIGIARTFLTQSSFSGGLHLWMPLSEQVSTFWLGAAIRQCLEAQGFIVKQGQLEIFPNLKAYAREGEFTQYQGHRLPLQPRSGSQLLDGDLNPMAGELERFFEIWDQCAVGQDKEQLQQAIAQAQRNQKKRWTSRKPSVVDSWRHALEFDITEGWTDYGQTNHLLKQIACYGIVFLRLEGEALVEYVQRTATNCPGYSQWCRHQHEITIRCTAWARAAEGYYWHLGTEATRQKNLHRMAGANTIVPFHRTNQARSEDAQARITRAFNQLKEEGQLAQLKSKTALENAIVKIAQCSKQTTRKYIHLWYSEANQVTEQVTEQVCTNDIETTSALSTPGLAEPQKSLQSLVDNEVHTEFYMKGLEPVPEAASGSKNMGSLATDWEASNISNSSDNQASLQPISSLSSSLLSQPVDNSITHRDRRCAEQDLHDLLQRTYMPP